MAALDFPASSSSPWTDPNGNVWVWNGTGWAQKIPYPGSAAEVLNTVVPYHVITIRDGFKYERQ